jgi:CheY-like chemotaxis protein
MSDLLRRSLGESVTVHTRLADELWNVTVDPTELEAAILNLAVNARDAMPGGGSLTIRTENVPAQHRSGADDHGLGHCMLLCVSDTGCGMTEDEAGQAFEPFFTTKSDGQGTGLGLSHVYGFVKQSGGDVRIETRPGHGTTVKVYLPRCDDADSQRVPAVEAAPVDTHRDSVPAAREGETVLVVEDDPEVRRWTVGILEELGYRVLSAGNADEALSLVAREPGICLLLTDLGLPGGTDGKQLAECAHSQREDLKVLITTGYAGDALVREGRLEPGVELLNKPFTRSRLGARIREVLDADGAIKASGHLLVVDDDPMVRFFISEMLTHADLAVVEAESVREALEKFAADPARYAAAILDFNLPDGSGRDLLGRFRELREDLPVILATGYPPDMIEPPVPEGALTRFLVKPFQFEDLVAALQRVGLRGLPRS